MYFVTQISKKDPSSFAQVATFFVDKFPLAFGGEATYTNERKVTSDSRYIRMDAVASVAYDFENEQHAQTFAPFEERVLSCFAKETEG